jgi:integrase
VRRRKASARRDAGYRHAAFLEKKCHDKGVPGKVVAQLMAHANVDTTLNVYTQVLDGSARDAVEKIGGELFAGRNW